MRKVLICAPLLVCMLSVLAPCEEAIMLRDCEICSDTTGAFSVGGPYRWSVPHEGRLKVLVVFAKHYGDEYSGYQFLEWTPEDTMPQYASYFIDPDTIPGELPVPSLNDYYREMSAGKFMIYGDYYPEVVIADSGMIGFPYSNLNMHIIDKIADDTDFDFADFDTDCDSVVDMVFMVWRLYGDSRGFARSSIWSLDDYCIETWDGTRIGDYGVSVPDAGSFRRAVSIIAHEMWHKMEDDTTQAGCFNPKPRPHLDITGPYGVSNGYGKSRGLAMSAYERYRLCWYDEVTVISEDVMGLKIPDSITSDRLYMIYIDDDTTGVEDEFFFIENRQRNNWYSEKGEAPWMREQILPGKGLLIWHVDLKEDDDGDLHHKMVDIESASGLFDWPDTLPDPFYGLDGLDSLDYHTCEPYCGHFDSLDFFHDGWSSNTFTPYTNPNTNGYEYDSVEEKYVQTRHAGISLTNIRQGTADTMIVDIHLDAAPDTIEHDTNWANWVMLSGDVVVPDSVRLTIEPGTIVSLTPKTDSEESGADSSRVELIVDGDLHAVGQDGTGGRIEFRPAGPRRGYSPSMNDWYGIRLRGSAGDSLAYCDIGCGYAGVRLNDQMSSTNPTLINRSKLHQNMYAGVECDHANPIIDSCLIEYNGSDEVGGIGVYICHGDAVVRADTIRRNLPYNVYWIGGNPDSCGTATIRDCIVAGYGHGDDDDMYGIVLLKSFLRGSQIVNTTVKRNSQVGIEGLYHWGYARVDSCIISNNYTGIFVDQRAQAPPGEDDTLVVCNSEIRLNTVGAATSKTGGTLILGIPDLGGYNSLTTNTTDVSNQMTDTLMAQNNWWGIAPPDTSKLSGPVCYDPWLLSEFQLGPRAQERSPVMTVDICPNPSSGAVAFRLSTPRSAHVRVCVYDVRGRLVSRPLEGQLAPGTHSLAWDGDDASGHPVDSGIYFCRVELGGKVHASKIVILRQ